MKERILSLDLARGFTVAFIAPVHCMMLFGNHAVLHSWLGWLFRFVSEGPGAQLFMLLMGISFSLSDQKNAFVIFKRALLLFGAGYLLNVLKFGVPGMFGMMPAALLQWLEVANNPKGYLQLILTGDILQVAGLSLMVLVICKKLFVYRFLYFILAIIVCFISPLLWDLHSDHFFIDYLLQLTGGKPPRVFFPLFPWLVYPLFGVYAGMLIKNKMPFKIPKLWVISILIGSSCMVVYYFVHFEEPLFYRTNPLGTLMHLLVVLVWLYAWHLLSKWIPFNKFFGLLQWLSKNITSIYFLQWVLLFWSLPLFGFQKMGFFPICVLMGLVVVNVWGLVYVFNEIRGK